MKRLLMLLAAGCLTACNLNVEQPGDNPTDPATETFDPSLKVDIPNMTKTTHGVYYKDFVIGTGQTLTGTPFVEFSYAGYLKNGAVFDSGSITAPLSLTQLVGGMQEGMQGMKEGGERLIVIPSELGYGPNVVGAVPANSTLIFDVRLDVLP